MTSAALASARLEWVYPVLFKFIIFAILATYVSLLLAILVRRIRPGGWFKQRLLTPEPRPRIGAENGVLIEVVDVDKSFDHPVLKGLSLKIYRGETLGVLGRSGTGKSVLLKLLVGLLRPDSGKVLFEGQDIALASEDELLEIRKRVSYVFQGGATFDFLNVAQNIAFPLRELGWTDEDRIRERVGYLLEAVELEGWGEATNAELSVGAKKQVAIARAIAINPHAILYDEPTTGVDPLIGKSLSRLIRKLNRQEHLTSVVVTHDLRCIDIVADRIIMLKDGLIRFEGSKEEFHSSQDPFIQAFIAGKRYEEQEVEAAG